MTTLSGIPFIFILFFLIALYLLVVPVLIQWVWNNTISEIFPRVAEERWVNPKIEFRTAFKIVLSLSLLGLISFLIIGSGTRIFLR